jgi:SAM-dependent methyltransferase
MGVDRSDPRHRTVEDTRREYDREKYAECLAFLNADPSRTPEDVRRYELRAQAPLICVSSGAELFAEDPVETRDRFIDLVVAELASIDPPVTTVVELGCGYGYNLWRLAKARPELRYVGGDFSANAVELARLLYSRQDRIEVQAFDLYDERYPILVGLGRVVVLTIYAVSMMPAARNFVDALRAARASVAEVIQFEPLYELEGETTLLGLMRRRYVELNDYNRDLFSEVRGLSDVEITAVRHDVHGVNPLYPASLLRWRFRG